MTPRFAELFRRQVLRQWLRHPLLAGLNILSIALGVSVFLAVQIANRGALASFHAAAEMTTGRADLEIRGDLPDEVLPAVQAAAGVRSATPLLEGIVTLPDLPGEYLRILGVDPLTGRDVFSFQLDDQSASQRMDIEKWLANPEGVAVQPELAEKLRPAEKEGRLRVLAGTAERHLRPVFRISPDDAAAGADPHVAAMDIGWAQELLGTPGRLTSIQVVLDDKLPLDDVIAALQKLLPPDATVARPARRNQEMETLLGAFQLNLTAMSLVSVIVGMFLIANSVRASVVRRQVEIAILRASGATKWEVKALFLGEALFEALIGSALGLLLAPLLAGVLSTPISQTVSSLYEVIRITRLDLTPWQCAEAITVGISAALLAAWMPASEAAALPPARVLHPGSSMEFRKPLRPMGLVWTAFLLMDAWLLCLYSLNGGPRLAGFAAAGAIIVAFSLLAPWAASGIGILFRRGGVLTRLASEHLLRSLHRNASTIAALAAAVAMSVSVAVMIHSFRASVARWIDHTLIADLYIAPALNEIAGLEAFLPAEAKTWAQSQPGVTSTATFVELPIRHAGQLTQVAAVDGAARGEPEFLEGSAPNATQLFDAGEAVAVSESFATRFGIAPRGVVTLLTPRGEQRFPVCGIYRDYSRDRGIVMMRRSLFQRYWPETRFHSLAVKLADPSDAGAFSRSFQQQFGRDGQFSIYNNATLRQRVFQIFDRTFAVTSVLRGIAVLVAAAGVLFSLTVLVTERQREIGVLRAIGASRGQVLTLFLVEALLIGLSATICGLASGAVLAMVLTLVINKAFFGWTIALAYPLLPLATTPLWLLPVAALAALIPAWRASRIAPASAVRFE